MLSYYSMTLTSIFIPEGCMALYFSNNRDGTADCANLYDMMSAFADLLKNEHLFDHAITREKTFERAQFFV